METRLLLGRSVAALAAVALMIVPATRGAQPAEPEGSTGGPDWTAAGHDVGGTRSQPFERLIGPATVARLAPRWVVTTAGDVSATPAVVDGAFAAGGSVNAGAAVSRGSVYWGSGYARSGTGNNKLYAFSLDGR
jgi:polyvinyl alcohol dehydrogenase (cytochrome)